MPEVGVLVEEGLEGLLGDVHLHVLAPHQRLAGEPGVGPDVEGLVQPVGLGVLLLGE